MVEPIAVDYRGHQVWQIPPNAQGVAALQALKMVEGTDMHVQEHLSERAVHLQAEAMKIAQQYRHWICDEAMMARAREKSIYMHCLPADRGCEVSDAVIDGVQSRVYPQAENRLHTAKALMALTM